MKVKILYGFLEGPMLGKKLAAECIKRGYEITNDDSIADTFIAHSGGWLFLPIHINDRKVVLINISHKSEVPISKRFYRRVSYDIKHVVLTPLFFHWLKETAFKLIYLFTNMAHWIQMAKRFNAFDASILVSAPNAVVIESADSSWHDETTMSKASNFIKLNHGDHDDCWRNPAIYLDTANL